MVLCGFEKAFATFATATDMMAFTGLVDSYTIWKDIKILYIIVADKKVSRIARSKPELCPS